MSADFSLVPKHRDNIEIDEAQTCLYLQILTLVLDTIYILQIGILFLSSSIALLLYPRDQLNLYKGVRGSRSGRGGVRRNSPVSFLLSSISFPGAGMCVCVCVCVCVRVCVYAFVDTYVQHSSKFIHTQ